jgi:hypothetical protein
MIKKVSKLLVLSVLSLVLFSCAPVTVETSPSGATVYSADGQTELGATPYKTQEWFSKKDVIVKKDRYFDEPVMMNHNTEKGVFIQLRPTPVSVCSTPQAEIYPAGSDTPIGITPMLVPVGAAPASYILKCVDYYDKTITVSATSSDPMVAELARRPIVAISAEPAGVEVYENDQCLGTAPLRIEVLSPRTIELRKDGYFTKKGTLSGAPPYEVHSALRPFPVITVSAEPADAQISCDSKLLGKGTAKLSVGESTTLDIFANRYYPQRIVLTPESAEKVSVKLKAMPYVMIDSQPSGAEVLIDGKSIGTTPVEQLVEKSTVIELSKEGYVSKSATLTGADAAVTLTLEEIPVTNEVVAAEQPVEAAPEVAPEPEKEQSPSVLAWALGAVVVVAALIAIAMITRKKS